MNIKVVRDGDRRSAVLHLLNCGPAVHIEDKKVDEWINQGVEHLQQDAASQFWYASSGNRLVLITRGEDEGEYEVNVTEPKHAGYIST